MTLKRDKEEQKKQKQICPVCEIKILPPNSWVRFHVKYAPPIEIFACKYCNYVEFCLRTGKIDWCRDDRARIFAVREYMLKFGINL